MTEKNVLVPLEQKQVLFYEDEITAIVVVVNDKRRVYVPLRPICDYMELSWAGQYERLQRDPVLSEAITSVRVTRTQDDQPREMICLPLDYLNGWLFGINANRVKSEIRARLLRYQRECYQILSEAFQEGRLTTDVTFEELLETNSEAVQAYRMALAVVKLARNQVLLEARLDTHERDLVEYRERLDQIETKLGSPEQYVTEEQASQISQAVKAVALAIGKKTKRNEFGAIYGEFYRRYGLTSYKMLPKKKFEDAMKFLTDWYENLTGETAF